MGSCVTKNYTRQTSNIENPSPKILLKKVKPHLPFTHPSTYRQLINAKKDSLAPTLNLKNSGLYTRRILKSQIQQDLTNPQVL